MSMEKSLEDVRREIDVIDDSIDDLIIRRTELVERVRDLKSGDAVKIRPSREARILHRIVSRHTGSFPTRELARIWRELIVATLAFEGPFSVAVYQPKDDSGYWDLARDQYGSFTPMTSEASTRRIIEAVRNQDVTLGILPLPTQPEEDPWWPRLVATTADMPKIVARLPFIGRGNGRGGIIEAVVVCPVMPEPTGRDRSYLVIETKEEVGRSRFADALAGAGLETEFISAWSDTDSAVFAYLAEVEGFVTEEDERIQKFRQTLKTPVTRVIFLGSYSMPLDAGKNGQGSASGPKSP